ncbi:MAG: T9SS type A sorting domain-containing protein [Ignavibacteriales bacterium]|nr:T9SS type A sorting domain-containing protein [Ignavibacteriales bacterium]
MQPKYDYRIFNPANNQCKLKIFNLLGQELITLLDEIREVGTYRINFDAKELNSGMYFYTLEAGGYKETRKMILIK